MALTPRGIAHIWTLLARELPEGGILRVSDGTGDNAQTAETPVVRAQVVDGPMLEVEGHFGSGEANFDWRQTTVIVPTGTELDVEPEDLGRKAAGSDWSLVVRLKLTAG
jgi:hypothetical protein